MRKASFCKVSSFLSLSFCSHKKSDTSKEKGWWELCVWMDQGWLTLVVECNQDPECEAGLSGSMTWRQSHCHLQSDNPALLQKSLRPQKVVKNRTNQDLCTAVRRPKLMFLEPFVSPIGCFGQLNDALFTKLVGKAKGMEKGGGSILRSWQGWVNGVEKQIPATSLGTVKFVSDGNYKALWWLVIDVETTQQVADIW